MAQTTPATIAFLVVFVCSLPGCLSLRGSDAASFYLLSVPLAEDATPVRDHGKLIIGIGPVDVPEYLNRSQIVIRRGPNELQLADFHKWAEPLKDGIARVLAKRVGDLLSVETVFFPWRRTRSIDYQVMLQVVRLDTDEIGNAALQVRWGLWKQDGREEVLARTATYHDEAQVSSYADRVAAMSRLLAMLGDEIAEVLADQLR